MACNGITYPPPPPYTQCRPDVDQPAFLNFKESKKTLDTTGSEYILLQQKLYFLGESYEL